MRTGILGGTFNPIHYAHLRVAEEVREACALDRVLFIPAAAPPHKPIAEDVPFIDRMAMVQEAIADNPFFFASDLEARREGKSYSVHTLEILRREYPEDDFFFIIGMDSFRDLSTWREYRKLFELTHLAVAARPGVKLENPLESLPIALQKEFCYDKSLKKMHHCSGNEVIFLEETLLDISSTRIRRLVSDNHSVRYLVPSAVETYIREHGLYRRS
jgi:nicotinate-nucleotide adenylyltransferase